jgi:hypothetical protein
VALEESERKLQDAQHSAAAQLADMNEKLHQALQRVAAIEAQKAVAAEGPQDREEVQVGHITWGEDPSCQLWCGWVLLSPPGFVHAVSTS